MAFSFQADGFVARFTALFDAQEWEQTPLAERVAELSGYPMNQPRISTLLRGKAEPSLQEVEALALALGVSPGWLAYEEGRVPAKLHTVKPLPKERLQKIEPTKKRRQS